MAHSKAEAQRRLKDARAAKVAADRALAQYDAHAKALARLRARWMVPALWQRANGKVERVDLAALSVARVYGDSADATRTDDERRARLLAGTLRVRTGLPGSDEAKVRAVSTRLRVVAGDDAKRLAYLDRTIARLWAEREALIGAATWQRGARMTEGEVADLALDHDAEVRKVKLPKGGEYGRWNLVSKAEQAERDELQAVAHKGAIDAGAVCECSRCQSERMHAKWEQERIAREKAEAARLKALPRFPMRCHQSTPPHETMGTWDSAQLAVRCPQHGAIRSSSGLAPLVEHGWISVRTQRAIARKLEKEAAA